MTQSLVPAPQSQPLLVGIDWADQQHAVCTLAADGTAQLKTLSQDPDSIAEWVRSLKEQAPGPILIALEQSRGALVHALLEHQGLLLYPLNPDSAKPFTPRAERAIPPTPNWPRASSSITADSCDPIGPTPQRPERSPSWPKPGVTSWKTANASCNA
jgi:hypothetical protein